MEIGVNLRRGAAKPVEFDEKSFRIVSARLSLEAVRWMSEQHRRIVGEEFIMLRITSALAGLAKGARPEAAISSRPSQSLQSRRVGKRPVKTGIVAVAAATALTGGVAADTLAQPKDVSLERQAANYIQFREDVAVIETAPFNNADVTREAHRRLAAHEADSLSAGWVAYAALVAADTPAFAKSVEKELSKKRNRRKGTLGGRDGLMSNLAQNPRYASGLDGAEAAIGAILAMTVQDGARITSLGEAFKEQAYAMQKTSWGKQRLSSSQDRLNEAAAYGANRGAPVAPTLASVGKNGAVAPSLASANASWEADWGAGGADAGQMSEANAQVIMDRILNLAARYSAGALNGKVVEVYARNDKSNRCLSMAKLTLDQCIAATRTPYEEAFCLGEHGLNDVSNCLGWVAGAGS